MQEMEFHTELGVTHVYELLDGRLTRVIQEKGGDFSPSEFFIYGERVGQQRWFVLFQPGQESVWCRYSQHTLWTQYTNIGTEQR